MQFTRKQAVVVPAIKPTADKPIFIYVKQAYDMHPPVKDGEQEMAISQVIDLEAKQHRQLILTTQVKDAFDKMVRADKDGKETETYVGNAFEIRMVGEKKSAGGRTFFQMEMYQLELPNDFNPDTYCDKPATNTAEKNS